MDDASFGEAETLSKAKNTAVSGLVEAGILLARGGKVRLLKRDELLEDWTRHRPPLHGLGGSAVHDPLAGSRG